MGSVRPYRGKRAVDLALVAAVLAPALVIGLLCAIAIKLASGGPVLFRQERVGQGGHRFWLVKFRTMLVAPAGNPVYPDAALVTAVGRWLRRLSLDELPQLINVLRGQMSVVGPRPTLAYQVARYDERQRRRLDIRPGIVGLAQIRGRNGISWPERIEYDLKYIEAQSLWLDLRILAGGAVAVVRGTGLSGHPIDDPLARTVS